MKSLVLLYTEVLPIVEQANLLRFTIYNNKTRKHIMLCYV